MNIQTMAYNLKREQKIKKKEIRSVLEELYNATEDLHVREKLALLYETMVPKNAPKGNPLSWVRLATDLKCDKNVLDKMFVHKGCAIGADRYRIHVHKLPDEQATELEGKVIDENANIIDIDTSKIPQVERLFSMFVDAECPLNDTFDLSKCVIEADEYSSRIFFDIELFGQPCRFNKKHIEQAFNGRKAVQVCTTSRFDGRDAVRFMLSETETAVVMPVQI